jgi:serine/threonine-protein kinase
MPKLSDDYDLLFGVTAVELRFLTHEQLVESTAAGRRGGATLRERVCELKLLTPAEADAVEAVVAQRVVRCGGDVHKTLAAADAKPETAGDSRAPTQVDRYRTQPLETSAYAPQQRQRFTVLRLHRQGGLGRLMIALDTELNREIALKEILPTFADDAENRRRFVREAEITGALEHPGVAPVYSLGEFHDGRPYYAMRLIRGVDLRTALDDFHATDAGRGERELAFRQLLARFVAVCLAIDYAHSRGVIHRDIKPSNIMLGDFGETLVVDWGIAKPIHEVAPADIDTAPIRLSSKGASAQTQAGRMVGTLPYMSPEQAAGRLDLVSTASDVYGLGATLYHILTGQPPFASGGDDTASRVLQGRFERPRAVAPLVPKPLEAICLKAMSRQTAGRYASARELANDIERYLADEPVAAYAEPAAARAWRWVRHHRTPVMSGMAGAAVAIAGLLVGVALLRAERDRAEANFELAQQAVRDYYIRVSEDTLLNQLGMQPLRDELLRGALAYYLRFLDQRKDDPQLRREVAQAQFLVGKMTETIDSPEAALPHYREATRLEGEMLLESPHDETLLADHAQTLNAIGRAHQQLERYDDAGRYFHEAASLRERLAAAAPDDAERARALASSVMNQGVLLLAAGRAREALPLVDRAQSLRLAHAGSDDDVSTALQRDIGMGYYNAALVQLALDDVAAAEASLLEASGAFERLVKRQPQDFDARRRLALCGRMIGDVHAQNGDAEAAVPFYEQARDVLAALVERNPEVPEYGADLAGVRMNLGVQLQSTGANEAALSEMTAAAAALAAAAAAEGAPPRYRRDWGAALRAAGELLAALDRTDEARTRLNESRAAFEQLRREFPQESAYAEEIELTREALAELDAF